MNPKSSRTKIVLGSAIGTALVLPLLLSPASAAMDGSHFLIHAQDSDTPKPHEATAGLRGLQGDGPTDGGGSTGGDSSAVLATYSSGPLSFKVTQAMLDFSAANVKAKQEGRTGDIKTDPNGWQTIWFKDSSGKISANPIGADESGLFMLSKLSTTPYFNSYDTESTNPDLVAFYQKDGSSVEGFDSLVARTPDTTFYYKKDSSSSELKEGRYVSEDGKTIAVTVDNSGGSNYTVKRRTSATDLSFVASSTKPFLVSNGNYAEVRLKDKVDGYDYMRLESYYPDLTVTFGAVSNSDRNGNLFTSTPSRKNGPSSISTSEYFGITDFTYIDADGYRQYPSEYANSYTVADYNRMSGQNWDGSSPKLSDFDLTKPFQPKDY